MRYDQLDVYKLAFELALDIHKVTLEPHIPKFEQYGGLCDQLRRASKSICANIAEGLSKHGSVLEERRFLGIALGSCEEVQVWLSFGLRLNYCTANQFAEWQAGYQSTAKMLQTLMKKREDKAA